MDSRWLILWAIGCSGAGPKESQPPEDTETTETSEPLVATGETGETGSPPATSNISDVELCELRDPTQSDRGADLHIATFDAPDVVCNDGTPAIAHIRAATNPIHTNKWVVSLEGGGQCDTHEGCIERWCGTAFYDVTKMTSSYAPNTRPGLGLHSPDSRSAFASWNHVFLYYCSSDLWVGDATSSLEGDPSFSLHFRGHRIIEHVLGTLEVGLTSDDGEQVLPSLLDATDLIFGGSSAGGWGAGQHIDSVAARYPSATTRGVVDAMFYVDTSSMSEVVVDGIATDLQVQYDERLLPLYNAYLDESCVSTETDKPSNCSNHYLLQRDHVATPLAINFDLADPVMATNYLDLGASQQEFIEAASLSLRQMADARPDFGMRGIRCGNHANLYSDPHFFESQVVDAADGAGPLNLHDLVGSMFNEKPAVAIDSPLAPGSACP